MGGIVVIGGGIAGASVAMHLAAKTTRPVTVFERDALAAATTAKSAAFFGHYGTPVERQMKRYGLAQYNEFAATPRGHPQYDLVGRLRVATTTAGARELEAYSSDEPTVECYQPSELHEALFIPPLDTETVTGATYRAGVGYFDPRELANEFVARAREHGVAFDVGARVEDITVADRRVTGVVFDGSHVSADAVVCAAGPWNRTVARWAGVRLPVTHSEAPILAIDHGRDYTLPIVHHAESGVYLRGHRDGTILIGHYPPDRASETMEPDRVRDRVPDDTRDEMWRVVESVLPGLADADVRDEWVGVRSHTPDGNPVIGWTGVEGCSVVAFNSSGIQLAPAAGFITAEQLLAGRPTEYYDAVTISRFDGRADAPLCLGTDG